MAPKNSLKDHLIDRITRLGPLSISEYMSECLLHPTLGYYTTRDPLGAKGDFTTAPEISQMFGELIGLCLAQAWQTNGAPKRFQLVELGPGRGTLMADILRATANIPGFHEAAEVHLIEASEKLRARQADRLHAFDVQWHGDVASLPDLPIYLVANEFFDALPIRQFIRQEDDKFSEHHVGATNGVLEFGLTPPVELPQLAYRLDDTKPGDTIEINSAGQSVAGFIAGRIEALGGMALIIDYGSWRSNGDTLQALADHKKVSPLSNPGRADITAHVDFEELAIAAGAHCKVTPPLPQGVFLERLGITDRARQLARNMVGDALEIHIAAHRRLTHPSEMGNLFQVMALYDSGAAAPPGFDE